MEDGPRHIETIEIDRRCVLLAALLGGVASALPLERVMAQAGEIVIANFGGDS